MTLLQQRSKSLSDDLEKFISKAGKTVTEKGVHRLRTTIRRAETLVNYTKPKLGKKQQKALDELHALRKRAGKVRDLDIQLGLLASIGNRSASADRRALNDALKSRRARQAQRLASVIKKVQKAKFLDRLDRITEKAVADAAGAAEPLHAAQQELGELATEYSSRQMLKPARLHDLRIKLKLLRYRAELASETPVQQEFIERVKSVQDAIGEWHDWEMLADNAEKQFGERINCALLVEVRSLLAARFSAATSAALGFLATCTVPGKKKPVSVQTTRAIAQTA